jgi:dATP pyrophosphohydrolase
VALLFRDIVMTKSIGSSLSETLRSIARTLGADLFGAAPIEEFTDYSGKRSPSHYLQDVRSVIVIGMHLHDPILDAWIGSATDEQDFYVVNEILGNAAHAMIRHLAREHHQAVLSPYSGIFSKEAAALAQMGVIGKNNLLITRQYGPRVRLRTIVTDINLHLTTKPPRDYCTDCSRPCWSACPAQAFRSGQYDRDLCEAYSEKNAQKLSENAILFCQECERACPVGMASDRTGTGSRMPLQVLVFPYYIEANNKIQYALFLRPKTAGGFWQAIAGGVEQGETVLMAARREMYEETGIKPDGRFMMLRSNASIPVTGITGEFTWGPDILTAQEYCFGAQVTDKNLTLSQEHVEYRWMDYETALTLLKYDSNKHALWELNERLTRQISSR